jgi:hypothetical protein
MLTCHAVRLRILRKGTRIEVYLIGRDGLKLIKEFGLYGEIACLEPFRPTVCCPCCDRSMLKQRECVWFTDVDVAASNICHL